MLTKRTGVFDVKLDVQDIVFSSLEVKKVNNSLSIQKALETVIKQMKISGFRSRTIIDHFDLL